MITELTARTVPTKSSATEFTNTTLCKFLCVKYLIEDKYFFFSFSDGFGEVMQNSFGIWHTKCFPKAAPPTQEQLEYLCKQLGFGNVARAESRITNPAENERQSKDDVQVEFHSINATKVVFYSKFSAVKVNDDFTVHLRPSQPLATLVEWDKTDHENCHRMDLKCVT